MSRDVENSQELRKKSRAEHLDRLQQLKNAGRLIIAGPFPATDTDEPGITGVTGSLIIAEFDSLTSAQQWADADPFVTAGVYDEVTVKPYKKVLP